MFRIRIEHLVFALIGAAVALLAVANVGPVRTVTLDYLAVDSLGVSESLSSIASTPKEAVDENDLEDKLADINDSIELREIEQGQLLGKAITGALTESPESLQRMKQRAETLEEEIIELRAERDAIESEIRKLPPQPVQIITPPPGGWPTPPRR